MAAAAMESKSERMKQIALAALVTAALLPAGCGRGLRVTEIGPSDGEHSIMIASYPSEYKERVRQGLIERYRDSSRITLVPIEKLNSVDYRKFDALVIMDALHAWQMFNMRTRWFVGMIDEPEALKKLVIFFTAGKPSDHYTFMGIDAITAASEAQDHAGSVKKISSKIDDILEKK